MYAVIIGINYEGTSNALNGCINDAENILSFLKDEYEFMDDDEHLIFMTDNTLKKPTYKKIIESLQWLCNDRKEGDSLFFSFSGHGSSLRDRNHDEDDGKDEVLVPLDFQKGRYVVDDEIRAIIEQLPSGVCMFSICDCCHSGTSFDLRYNYRTRFGQKSMSIDKNDHYERTDASIIVLSGCKDHQTSADTWLPDPESGKYESQGALTGTLLNILRKPKSKQKSFEWVFLKVKKKLRKDRYEQLPQLTSGKLFDYEEPFHML